MEKVYGCSAKVTPEERETHLWIDGDDRWYMETTIAKDWKAALKQGWEQESVIYDDFGAVVCMTFSAPRHAVTIRSAVKQRRTMTNEQKEAAALRLALARVRKSGRIADNVDSD